MADAEQPAGGTVTMAFFFYGTLMDSRVLARISGETVSPACMETAIIEGYRRVYVAGAWYPMLVAAAGGRVEGRLVHGLGRRAADAIIRYEGGGYVQRQVTVETASGGPVPAWTFMARPGVEASAEEWRLDSWRRRHKRRYLRLTEAGLEE
jgi:gamma-glutamylcyclotransferase (GGCT)/AIG2-like uncharacterized protein YtfP